MTMNLRSVKQYQRSSFMHFMVLIDKLKWFKIRESFIGPTTGNRDGLNEMKQEWKSQI